MPPVFPGIRALRAAVGFVGAACVGPALVCLGWGLLSSVLIFLLGSPADPATCRAQNVAMTLGPLVLIAGGLSLLWWGSTGWVAWPDLKWGAGIAAMGGPFLLFHEGIWGLPSLLVAILAVPTYAGGLVFAAVRQRDPAEMRADDAPPEWVAPIALGLVVVTLFAVSLGHYEVGDACRATETRSH